MSKSASHKTDAKAIPSIADQLRPLFDPAFYRVEYPDLAGTRLDPLEHYALYGLREGRNPNPFFDSAWYRAHNPDVAKSGVDPLLHYLKIGAAELRNPHPRFDAAFYVERHPGAAANPLVFHMLAGRARGFATEPAFDVDDLPACPRPPAFLSLRRGGGCRDPLLPGVGGDAALPRLRAGRPGPADGAGHRHRRCLARARPVGLARHARRGRARGPAAQSAQSRLRRLGQPGHGGGGAGGRRVAQCRHRGADRLARAPRRARLRRAPHRLGLALVQQRHDLQLSRPSSAARPRSGSMWA